MIDNLIPLVGFLTPGETLFWKVERYEITPNQAAMENLYLRLAIREGKAVQGRGRLMPGNYTRLMHHPTEMGWEVMMSDVDDERLEHLKFVKHATDRVLITGLGLGVALNAVLLKKEVHSVVVIEKEMAVIQLVGEQYMDRLLTGVYGNKQLEIIYADAYEWKPVHEEHTFDAIWHDIWPNLCIDNLKHITKLKRRYTHWLRPGGWQGAWVEDVLRKAARRSSHHAYR